MVQYKIYYGLIFCPLAFLLNARCVVYFFNVKRVRVFIQLSSKMGCLFVVYFDRVISIVETILDLFSPSRGGISAVPMAILLTLRSLRKRCLAISATSTAVVIDCPRAFKVISFMLPAENDVMIART